MLDLQSWKLIVTHVFNSDIWIKPSQSLKCLKTAPKLFQIGPKVSQIDPPTCPKSVPKVTQIGHQRVPNWSPSVSNRFPKWPKSVPKVSQLGPQSVSNWSPKCPKSVPKLSQTDPWSVQKLLQKLPNMIQQWSQTFVNDFCEWLANDIWMTFVNDFWMTVLNVFFEYFCEWLWWMALGRLFVAYSFVIRRSFVNRSLFFRYSAYWGLKWASVIVYLTSWAVPGSFWDGFQTGLLLCWWLVDHFLRFTLGPH